MTQPRSSYEELVELGGGGFTDREMDERREGFSPLADGKEALGGGHFSIFAHIFGFSLLLVCIVSGSLLEVQTTHTYSLPISLSPLFDCLIFSFHHCSRCKERPWRVETGTERET